jgi:hypothetical protein
MNLMNKRGLEEILPTTEMHILKYLENLIKVRFGS